MGMTESILLILALFVSGLVYLAGLAHGINAGRKRALTNEDQADEHWRQAQ